MGGWSDERKKNFIQTELSWKLNSNKQRKRNWQSCQVKEEINISLFYNINFQYLSACLNIWILRAMLLMRNWYYFIFHPTRSPINVRPLPKITPKRKKIYTDDFCAEKIISFWWFRLSCLYKLSMLLAYGNEQQLGTN